MADIKWVKLATDIFSNRKTKQIEALPEGDTMLLIWIKMICLAGQINDNGNIYLVEDVPYTPEGLSREFARDAGIVRLALETFTKLKMIDIDESGVIHITGWDEYQSVNGMERAKLKNKERQQKLRDRKREEKQLTDSNDTQSVTRNVTHNVTESVTDNVTVTDSSYSYSPSISNSNSYSLSDSQSESIPDTGVSTDTVTHTPTPSSKKKESKKRYGEFDNVLLTDTELEKLQEQFPDDWQERIEELSDYIATRKKKYENHLATIRSWARREAKEQKRASPPAVSVFRPERTHSERVRDMMAEAMEMVDGTETRGAYGT